VKGFGMLGMRPLTSLLKLSMILVFMIIASMQAHAAALCPQAHNTPLRIDLMALPGTVRTFYRDGFKFQLIRLDPNASDGTSSALARRYFGVYEKALKENLQRSPEFFAALRKNDEHVLRNSHLLLMFDPQHPESPIGGAAFVIARHSGESLAFEKELGLDFFSSSGLDSSSSTAHESEPAPHPTEYPIAEVARVGLRLGGTKQRFASLVNGIVEIIRESPEIRHTYGFTSEVQQRLYSFMGHKTARLASHQTEPKLRDGDVIIEIKAEAASE